MDFVKEHSGERRWHRHLARLVVLPKLWAVGGKFGLHLLVTYASIGSRGEEQQEEADPFGDALAE